MERLSWHHGTTADPKFRLIAKRCGHPVAFVVPACSKSCFRFTQTACPAELEGLHRIDLTTAYKYDFDLSGASYTFPEAEPSADTYGVALASAGATISLRMLSGVR